MSDDFLNKFSKDKYSNLVNDSELKKEKKKEIKKKQVEENLDLEDLEIINEEKNKVQRFSDEHEVFIDDRYKSKQKKKKIFIISGILLGVLLIVLIYILSNQVTMKNFVGKDLSELSSWVLKNGIEVDTEYVFSTKYDSDIVVSQSAESNKKISKGSLISVSVSKGADPDERIILPDFSTMTTSEVETWINENKAINVRIIKTYNEKVDANKFIKLEFRDDDINEENYLRKYTLNVYMSRGKETYEKDIQVIDLSGKTKAEVITWAAGVELEVIYKERDSEAIMEGFVISQSVKAGEYIARNDEFIVTISTGKVLRVPNFSNILMEDAPDTATGMTIKVKTIYSEKVAYGKFISQSIKAGTKLKDENTVLTVIYSEGRPYIDDLTLMTEKELPEYFYNFQKKGANITYKVDYVNKGNNEKGSIESASHINEFVGLKTVVNIKVYK